MKRLFAGLCVAGLLVGSSGAIVSSTGAFSQNTEEPTSPSEPIETDLNEDQYALDSEQTTDFILNSDGVVSEMTPPPAEESTPKDDPSADYTASADLLYDLGLFQGSAIDASGQPIYELEQPCTRAEAAVMLVRLLGWEEQAVDAPAAPFTDLQDWQKPYVNILYQHHIVSGSEQNLFEPEAPCDAQMYAVLMLRALGYSEQQGDFYYETAVGVAMQIGLMDSFSCDLNDFRRDDAVQMNRMALSVKPKGEDKDLLELLVQANVVDADKAECIRMQTEQITALRGRLSASQPYEAQVFAALNDDQTGDSLSLTGTLIDEGSRSRLDGVLSVALADGYSISQQVTIIRDMSGIAISHFNNIGYRDDQIAALLRRSNVLSLVMSAMPARSLISQIAQQNDTYILPMPEGTAQIHFDADGVPDTRSTLMTLHDMDYSVSVETTQKGPAIQMAVPADYLEYIKLTNAP